MYYEIRLTTSYTSKSMIFVFVFVSDIRNGFSSTRKQFVSMTGKKKNFIMI